VVAEVVYGGVYRVFIGVGEARGEASGGKLVGVIWLYGGGSRLRSNGRGEDVMQSLLGGVHVCKESYSHVVVLAYVDYDTHICTQS